MDDGRALSATQLERIEEKVNIAQYDDLDMARLFETIRIQRRVLRQIFNLFTSEPLRLVSTADPIRNSQLRHFKELVSLEDGR